MRIKNIVILSWVVLLLFSATLCYAQYGYDYSETQKQPDDSNSIMQRIKEKPYVIFVAIALPLMAAFLGFSLTTFLVLSVVYFLFNIFLPNTGFIGEIILGVVAFYFLINRET
jgi:hypothetical protein